MLLNTSDSVTSRWAPRLVTFVVWALALASAAYWGLKSTADAAGPQTAVSTQTRAPIDTAAVARVLGAVPQGMASEPLVNPSTRFVLSGVIAGRGHGGAALIAVDGKPPKPYRVGNVVDGDLLLQSVGPRRAELANSLEGRAAFALELPVRK
ncbi:type II secretion system protein N [Rhodoferax sp.]|uniref:type II secretion system protein N n=1 Tax=Rhodoferax sp. TaxID=50421 RepID=UPI0025D6AA12|nr:type II secretion system protein N [Rhodoferax sp.]